GAAADLEEELAQARADALAGTADVGPRPRISPGNETGPLGARERDSLVQLLHLTAGQRPADDHARAFHEAAGLHPLGLCGQGLQVTHGVRDHGLPNALGAVEAR